MVKSQLSLSREIRRTGLLRGGDKNTGYLSLWSGREDPMLGTRGDEWSQVYSLWPPKHWSTQEPNPWPWPHLHNPMSQWSVPWKCLASLQTANWHLLCNWASCSWQCSVFQSVWSLHVFIRNYGFNWIPKLRFLWRIFI